MFEELFPVRLLPILPILIPLASALIVGLIGSISRRSYVSKIRDAVAVLGFVVTLYSAYLLAKRVIDYGIQTYVYHSNMPPLGVVFVADMFSVFLVVIFSLMGTIVSIYSLGYMKHDTGLTQYYTLLLVLIGAMNGVVLVGDLFSLYVFYELMSIASYVLVAFRKDNWEPIEAGFKYLVMSSAGSTLVLLAMSYLYGLMGSLNLGYLANAMLHATPQPIFYVLIALIIAGFGVKAAIVPFHFWLADAHPAAPSGISALLSGIVIKTGLYGIIRVGVLVFPIAIYNWPLLLSIFAVITITSGNLYALMQQDLKRLLAFSSVAQIGWIMLAFGTGTQFGFAAGIFAIANHAIVKGLLFLNAGAIIHAIGSRKLDDMAGLGKKSPIIGAFVAIGFLSLMGVPPMTGFWAKLLMFFSVISVGGIYLVFAVIFLLNAAIVVVYYLRVLFKVWFSEPVDDTPIEEGPTKSMIFALAVLSLLTIVLGIYPEFLWHFANSAANALTNLSQYISLVMSP